MPDFERILDQLRFDLADTPEKKAHAAGFIAGKRHARKEIALIVAFVAALVILIAALAAAH
ncbi:MAG: hypothetical protein V7756_12815 [Halopseudomonas sp.]|uniref:hypothetical protein n=1 Tax=Halopseudomonas sp. TaxID=2901191 RepID=UPI003003470A